ncbi:hypothetical protein [Ramlibacter sp. AN1133]|uniref:hypothetical protein n=1 Tax=Ramlibacter sp. AN1133 TaxID=3133429 RepID=UPI0030BF8501
MQNMNAISEALYALEEFYWLDGLAALLSGIHRDHGEPAPPRPVVARVPVLLPFLRGRQLEDLASYAPLAIAGYNDGVKAAYRCIDCRSVSLMFGVANDTRGNSAWSAYCQAALPALAQYFSSGKAWADYEAYVLDPAREYLGGRDEI